MKKTGEQKMKTPCQNSCSKTEFYQPKEQQVFLRRAQEMVVAKLVLEIPIAPLLSTAPTSGVRQNKNSLKTFKSELKNKMSLLLQPISERLTKW